MKNNHYLSTHRPRKDCGFTLIELLTVIAIIGILAAILIPVVGRVRESAHGSKCVSNVRSLVVANNLYALENGHFPPSQDTRSGRHLNWIIILSEGGYAELTVGAQHNIETLWFCPSAIRARTPAPGNANSYAQNWQIGGWYMDPTRPSTGSASRPELVPEPSLTAMVMDGPWSGTTFSTHVGRTVENFPDFVHPSSAVTSEDSSGRANVGFVDGHVRGMTRDEIPTSLDDIFWRGRAPTHGSGGFF